MSEPIDLGRVKSALALGSTVELARPRRAAVALVLAPSPAPSTSSVSLLLVRRSEREGDPWSGHMALPGGHAQPEDDDLLQTARRETEEEVGLNLTRAELLGQLDDLSPMRSSEIAVRPFVFWTASPGEVTLSSEVAEVLWVPLDLLAGDALRATREVEVLGTKRQVPAYVIDERVVWGMTFHLLEGFLRRVRPLL